MRIKLFLITFGLLGIVSFAGEAQAGTLGRPANNLGLVGYWSFDEGTSTTASDLSGKGNVGTLSGTTKPAWVSGKHGKALSFDGSTSYVSTAGPTIAANSAFTISAWVLLKPGAGVWPMIACSVVGASLFGVHTGTGSNTGFDLYLGGTEAGQTAAPSTDVWYNVVGTYDGTNARLYVGGNLISTSGTGSSPGLAGLNIGYGTCLGNSFWKGLIDDVRVYNRALGATEIAALYKSGGIKIGSSQGSTITNGLVGRWTFDGKDMGWTSDTAGSAYDISGNNNGTLTSMNRSTASAAGKVGQALKLDGSNDTINMGDPANGSLDFGTGDFSASYWINIDGTLVANTEFGVINKNSSYQSVAGWGSEVATWNCSATTYNMLGYITNQSSWGNTTAVTTGCLSKNQWNHFVMTRSGTSITAYLNGVLQQTTIHGDVANTVSNAQSLIIGDHSWGPNLPARLDDIRIYNRALTAAEVKRIYSEGADAKIGASSATLGGNGTLNQGLVGLWTFDGADLIDKVTDRSGTGNDGYFLGAATSSAKIAGKLGQALNFNGSSTYIRRGTFTNPPASQMTICTWLKTSLASNQVILNINRNAGNIVNEGVFIVRSTGLLRFWDYNGSSYGFADSSDSSAAVNDGSWHHACFVKNATSGAYYVDGAPSGTKTAALSVSYGTADWIIGQDYRDNSAYFNGTLDDVRVYNRALSAAEVKALYNMGK